MRIRAYRRWSLVVAAVAVLCALPSVVASLPVSARAPGPDQLRQRILASVTQPYRGYALTTGALGLPDLPALGDVSGLLSGTTEVRAWYRSPTRNRTDTLSAVGERDVYQTADATYTWDYASNLVTEIFGTAPVRLPRAGDLLPPALAQRVLTLDPTDPVTALPARRVAGIAAPGIRLRPADPTTRVGQVDIWADPATGLPLQIEITPRSGGRPVLVSRFFDIATTDPGDAALAPPDPRDAGFTVARVPDVLSALGNNLNVSRFFPLPDVLAGRRRQAPLPGLPGIGRYGTGLASFVVIPLPGNVGGSAMDAASKAGATTVAVPVGRAVSMQIPLLSVVLERSRSGRRVYLVAGLVDPAVLSTAAVALSQVRPRFAR